MNPAQPQPVATQPVASPSIRPQSHERPRLATSASTEGLLGTGWVMQLGDCQQAGGLHPELHLGELADVVAVDLDREGAVVDRLYAGA
jgi:hypothetical protein